jgi:hypothetical protein
MSKYLMIFMLVGSVVALVVYLLHDVPGPEVNAEPAPPLEGTLLSTHVEEIERSENPMSKLTQLTIPESDIKRLGLGSINQVLLKVVPDSSAKYRLLPKDDGRKKGKPEARIEKSTGTIPSPGAVSPPAPDFSFKYFNAILEKSESAYALNNRYTKGGITFEAEAVCKWKDLYLLKFQITNDEEREFFSTKIEVRVDGEALRSTFYAPFSCQPLRSTEGVVTFPADAVKRKKVSLIMVEGGERGRTFPIESVDYGF